MPRFTHLSTSDVVCSDSEKNECVLKSMGDEQSKLLFMLVLL